MPAGYTLTPIVRHQKAAGYPVKFPKNKKAVRNDRTRGNDSGGRFHCGVYPVFRVGDHNLAVDKR